MKIKLVFFFVLFGFGALYAQEKFTFSGKVTEAKSKIFVELVAVQVKELNRWTISDANGDFILKDLPAGNYTLQASCLGFEPYEVPITIQRNISGFKLMVKQSSLGLEEVTIVAKENTSLSSSSKIESTALEHVQPTGLADVMQLVPGQITLNPDMSKSNQITIRDINSKNVNTDANSAMGTAIVVDGTPVNNDANMQLFNSASGGTSQDNSTAGQGVDLRQISTDNIESVEVIRGIPSVEYGNLTTGAVVVKTKAGKTKLLVKAKADPNIKQTALSKGFLLPGENSGAMNIDADYTYAYDDMREPTKSYRRVTGQLGYSNTFLRESTPISLNAKVSVYSTFDNQKNDPDMLKEEIIQSKERSIGFKLYGTWSARKWWLTSFSYNFSGDFEKQRNYEYKVASGGLTPVPTAMESGESIGTILPSSYFSELTIDGRPYNYFGMLKGNITKRYNNMDNNLMFGAEWRTSGNKGKGRIYDMTRPPKVGDVSARPRPFNDIPASKELSLFIEDKIAIPIGKTKLTTQAGLRYTNLLPKGLFSTDGYTTLEPRVNMSYDIFTKRKGKALSDLGLRFGYGKTSKTPGMIFLYPDKAYLDEISFNYYPDLIVVTTQVFEDTSNPDLKPIRNTKFEAGVDFKLFGVNVMLTGFMEEIKDGFSWEREYSIMNFRKWDALAGAGKNPVFENGNITYTEDGASHTLPYTTEQKFIYYLNPRNNNETTKKGIEYVIDFGRIKALRTDLIVDGAYYNIKKIDDVAPFYEEKGITYQGKRFPYLSIFAGNKGKVSERLNSNIKVNTHIPKLRMITSITGMLVWLDQTRYTWEGDNGEAIAYKLGPNGEKLYGQYDGVDKINIDPVGYYDMNMQYHAWQDNLSSESPYTFMVKQERYDYFVKEKFPFTWQINLKLTKEIGNFAKLSFFANNIFNHRPLYKFVRSNSYTRLNQSAYFGAELKFTL